MARGTPTRLAPVASTSDQGSRLLVVGQSNVCMLIQSFHPHVGGAERQLQALIPRLGQRGIHVVVITRRYPGLTRRATVAGASVRRMPIVGGRVAASVSFTLASLLFLVRIRRRIDVLHAHELLSPTTTALAAKMVLRRPVVVKVLRGGRVGDVAALRAGKLGRLRLWLFARSIDRFITISGEIEGELQAAGVPRARIVRIPNGVDTDRFRPLDPGSRQALRAELGLEGRLVVVFVGRLEPEKGLDCLLDGWGEVRQALPEALLLLVGDGSARPALQARGAPSVRFIGSVNDPLPYLQAADCFVLPSYAEGLSNALLEAMATGLPSVATDIGGNTDLVRHDIEGRLVPAGDAPALGAALIGTLSPGERERLGGSARARVIREYSLESTADRLSALYRRLARGGAGV